MPAKKMTEKQATAAKVVELAKSLTLADNHYLASAVGRLSVTPATLNRQLATNGRELLFDADRVCETFLKSKSAPSRQYLHSILHCVFLHPLCRCRREKTLGPRLRRGGRVDDLRDPGHQA